VDCEVLREGSSREFLTQPGTERRMPADLVLLAIGFDGVACPSLVESLGGRPAGSGAIAVDADFRVAPGVFASGDATRGASLIVWAIADARRAAAACDRFLAASR
jgi:glutamate synthase (NADPH/NADH) small chain